MRGELSARFQGGHGSLSGSTRASDDACTHAALQSGRRRGHLSGSRTSSLPFSRLRYCSIASLLLQTCMRGPTGTVRMHTRAWYARTELRQRADAEEHEPAKV